MNILFCSVPYRPSIGGIETVSALLAAQFQDFGHTVVLVTRSFGEAVDNDLFRVERRPSLARLFVLVQWADVVFHNNISLRFAWPLLHLDRPWVIAHHTWIPRRGVAGRLKRWAIRGALNIGISRAMADSLPVDCTVVPNPYADDVFVALPSVARDGELLFVGRLVTDKGVDVLIDAMALLAQRGKRVRLTVIGDGPERAALVELAASLGVGAQISWAGRQVGSRLVAALNAHQVLVVPSVWEEPFGVVALEAMACGCVPMVARSGGLPEAVGAGGVVVARGDRDALADAIDGLVDNAPEQAKLREAAAPHLERHQRERVARDYLRVIDNAYRFHASQRSARTR